MIQQLYTKCLAQGAYYIQSQGEAAVIDPLREIQQYIDMAKNDKASIKYIFETHFHADFVSGHVDLAEKTGAEIVYGPSANTDFKSHIAQDEQIFIIGDLQLKVIHTPGHTPESVCYLLIDENGKEHSLFTGDTLFLGDVGRPDLAIKGELTQNDLAGMLFDSLRNKIMTLPPHITIYPAHGAGSSCGKNMSSETVGNLGEQLEINYALRASMTREEFIQEVTTGIAPPPQYFPKNAQLNKRGYESLDNVLLRGNKPLSVENVKTHLSNGALLLDVRPQAQYIIESIPASLFIGLNGTFAMWVGALIENIDQEIILLCPSGMELEAITRMARVGYDQCIGFINGGIEAWKSAGEVTESLESIPAESMVSNFMDLNIVDVRKTSEYQNAHLKNAIHVPLDFMLETIGDLQKDQKYHIHCAGGYRSVIAISVLRRLGFTKLVDIAGGFSAIKEAGIEVVS